MPDKVREYIQSIGSLVETWLVVNRTFMTQGLSSADALMHTREFMAAFMSSIMAKNKDEGRK